MSCEEYAKEINKMINNMLEQQNMEILSFIYKLLSKYIKSL